MSRLLLHRRLALGLLASTLLVASVWAVPSLCQAPPRGYARLLATRAAVPPDAVTDCRMSAIRLRGACGPDAAIPDEDFASLRDQCRQAAKAGAAGQRIARM
ncbi:hypothetical protein GTA51_04285 [Desulfovibrio aerotolerans]|uniref:Uncharacterized protein n=1 Tax=Solidesulfovibrio aerotolerans TaxID=295255 RepID=A0A7C9NI95_9BACT|nr:hypothetical protein [Solidesulfovibrio aerotolerans]MYL82356.1 hypothetical protein [Solidesulfovibrio aerotolerans]